MEWHERRDLFPMLREWTYFSWAATACLSTPAAEAMKKQIDGATALGGTQWKDWYKTYDLARAAAARLVGAKGPGEIALLKNTSEGVSTVAFGLELERGDNVIVPRGEFPANAYPWLALQQRGIEVRRVELGEHGRFTPREIEALMDKRTRAVALSFVNFATGFRADLAAVGKRCRARGIFFFVDAIQGLGALPLNVEAMQIDGLAADGHKWLCGPEGQAILYIREAWQPRVAPLSRGWWSVEMPGRYDRDDQELCKTARRYECGTLATVAAYGFLAALEVIDHAGVEEIANRIEHLTGSLVERLRAHGCNVFRAEGPGEWSGIVSFEVPGRDARDVAAALEAEKILVNPRGGRLRAAVHAWNDEHDLDRLMGALPRP
ncbi:MAG: aminotransferase class V-fold PLP-dependent enzyme [Planctomycetota bacterium]|nr:aminotransferase class V-fold PLP-dependent enzyme [Planctomycetota bacterium]